jgi:hypothetical protein
VSCVCVYVPAHHTRVLEGEAENDRVCVAGKKETYYRAKGIQCRAKET